MKNYYSPTPDFARHIWEHDEIGRVSVHFSAEAGGTPDKAAVVEALKDFFSEQKKEHGNSEYGELFFSGGHSFGVTWRVGELPEIILESAGEDAADSLQSASQDLAEAVTEAVPGTVLTFTELPFK